MVKTLAAKVIVSIMAALMFFTLVPFLVVVKALEGVAMSGYFTSELLWTVWRRGEGKL